MDRDGYYTYDQILKIEDDTDPVISVEEVSIVEIYDGAIAKEDTFENELKQLLSFTIHYFRFHCNFPFTSLKEVLF